MDDDGDTSAALIAELETGAELVSIGRFTLDANAARDKLRSYRLADPQAFILLFVEAAHQLPGCSRIDITTDTSELKILLHGVEFDEGGLRGILDAAGTSAEGLEPEAAARLRGQQFLALALAAAGHLEFRSARLRSGITNIQIELEPDGAMNFIPDTIDGGGYLSFELRDRPNPSAALAEMRCMLVRMRACYASVDLYLDQEKISEGLRLRELADPYDLPDRDGVHRAVIGWSKVRPEATMLLVANGVMLEKLIDEELPPNFLALIDVSDLPRDLSMARVLRQDAFMDRINWVRQAAAKLPPPQWPAPVYVGSPPPDLRPVSVVGFMGAFFAAIALLVLGFEDVVVVVIGVPMLLMLASVISVRNDLRRVQAYNRARLGIATIKKVQVLSRTSEMSNVVLDCTIALSGYEPYEARVEARVTREDAARLHPGGRVFIRADEDSGRLYLAGPPKSPPPKQLAESPSDEQ